MHDYFDEFDQKVSDILNWERKCRHYSRIMAEEAKLSSNNWNVPEATEMWNTTRQIAEFTMASTILRSYLWNYGLTAPDLRSTYESDAGHTNLMSAIVERALCYIYGPDIHYTEDGYTYREVMEAVRRHDLPENLTGDIPDDGTRDDYAKAKADADYQRDFSRFSPNRNTESEKRILRLLEEMEGKTSPTGKLIYLADKISAIIMVLYYDSQYQPPHRSVNSEYNTLRDVKEMRLCDKVYSKDTYYVSEMWTIDYFMFRRLVKYDDTGFFTALLVMYTLQVHHDWYAWREENYSDNYYQDS